LPRVMCRPVCGTKFRRGRGVKCAEVVAGLQPECRGAQTQELTTDVTRGERPRVAAEMGRRPHAQQRRVIMVQWRGQGEYRLPRRSAVPAGRLWPSRAAAPVDPGGCQDVGCCTGGRPDGASNGLPVHRRVCDTMVRAWNTASDTVCVSNRRAGTTSHGCAWLFLRCTSHGGCRTSHPDLAWRQTKVQLPC